MPTISSEYQAAEWSVLCSALEKPERFYELRREFSRSDFRDDASRAIWGTAMAILDAPDGLDRLREETPLIHKLEDTPGRADSVCRAACDVLLASRAGLREDSEWESWKGRLREIIRRHKLAVLEDKLKRAETSDELQFLAAQLTALQGGGKALSRNPRPWTLPIMRRSAWRSLRNRNLTNMPKRFPPFSRGGRLSNEHSLSQLGQGALQGTVEGDEPQKDAPAVYGAISSNQEGGGTA
jgi:hypothetical protein